MITRLWRGIVMTRAAGNPQDEINFNYLNRAEMEKHFSENIGTVILEDSKAIAAMYWEVLKGRRECGDIAVRDNGDDALRIIKANRVRTFVTDLEHPGMCGLEMIKKAREIGIEYCNIIVISAAKEMKRLKTIHFLDQLGVVAQARKPVDREAFIEILNQIELSEVSIHERKKLKTRFAREKFIRRLIGGILSKEDKNHPISDQKIVEVLKLENIEIARRTATQTRIELGFGSFRGRRRK
jgi:response regulator RpfG family c-di-GMP phosphodiesterase